MPLIKEFAVQLYSIRDVVQQDIPGSFAKLANLGYTGVEFAGYYGLSATEVKKLLNDNGLKSAGSHVGMHVLGEEKSLQDEIAFSQTIGTEFLIVPWADMNSREDALRLAESMNPVAEKIKAAGMKMAYHNHAHELGKDANGEYFLDTFYAHTCPESMFVELDMYWVAYAGLDPLEYMAKYPNRCQLLHLKQIESYETKKCVDLDKGVIDFRAVIEKGKELGVAHYVLEQEEFEIGPFESLKAGYNHIMNL
jgi:sugar phosphate isomerase/epimerase